MMEWHIGCSGFHYNHWRGTFYPEDMPQRQWFDFYCGQFNTLELNVTFYRFPQLPFLQNWYQKSPAGFKFAVKAPRAITHYKKFNNCADLLFDFYDVTSQGLQEKLGCVLFQLPPNYNYTPEKLDKIIHSISANPACPNVLEFRHPSWWDKTVYEQLTKHRISFCGMSHPLLPDDVISTNSLLYYRFHGVPDLYRSAYSTASLTKVVEAIRTQKKVKQVFAFFNNDIETSAIGNAKQMEQLAKK